jgi:hypothetical protein
VSQQAAIGFKGFLALCRGLFRPRPVPTRGPENQT